FSRRRQHTRSDRDWSSDVCSSDLLAFLRATTARRVKIAMTGPHMFACVAWDEHYGSREAVAEAMSAVVNEELRRLDAAGCDVIRSEERRVGKEGRTQGARGCTEKS